MVESEALNVIIINSFSWDTILTILSTFGTFIAILIALYLGNSYRRVIIIPTGHKINENTFNNNEEKRYHEISIYNASERKVRLQDYGYMLGQKKYTTKHNRIVYDLVRPEKKEIEMPFSNKIFTRTVLDKSTQHFPFYLFDGEDCRFGLFPGDYTFDESKLRRKLFVYIVINEKTYKYYTGLRLKAFLDLTVKIKDKSPFNQN